MKHIDLFSGVGGFSLAADWVWGDEHEIVCFVEIDPFCQKILNKHWPDVPIVEDVRDVRQIVAYAEGIRGRSLQRREWESKSIWVKSNSRIQRQEKAEISTNNKIIPTIDLLTGGFPCQSFSVAGKRGGKEDDRYLWPEMFRIIQETHPTWIIGENVAGIINMALDTVLSDLENEGYSCQAFIIPACAQNALHRRDRVWIVANADGGRWDTQSLSGSKCVSRKNNLDIEQSSQDVGNPKSKRLQRSTIKKMGRPKIITKGSEDVAYTTKQYSNVSNNNGRSRPKSLSKLGNSNKESGTQYSGEPSQSGLGVQNDGLSGWLVRAWGTGEWEEGIPRVATGVKDRVNKLKALGNAIVPQVVIPIMQAIKELEKIQHENQNIQNK